MEVSVVVLGVGAAALQTRETNVQTLRRLGCCEALGALVLVDGPIDDLVSDKFVPAWAQISCHFQTKVLLYRDFIMRKSAFDHV